MRASAVRSPGAAVALIASLAGLSAPLRAQADVGEDPCLPDAEGPPGARMFHKLDPLGTGRVTLAQFLEHRTQRFRWLDANGDGRITRAEFHAQRGRGSEAQRAAAFSRLDVDGDGVVPQAEWDATETRRFEGIDADHDGSVTREEFLADRRRVCADQANQHEAK